MNHCAGIVIPKQEMRGRERNLDIVLLNFSSYFRLRITFGELPSVGCGLRNLLTSYFLLLTSSDWLPTSDFGLRIADCGLRRPSYFLLLTSYFRLLTSDCWFRKSEVEDWKLLVDYFALSGLISHGFLLNRGFRCASPTVDEIPPFQGYELTHFFESFSF